MSEQEISTEEARPLSAEELARLVRMRPGLHVCDGPDDPRPNIVDRLLATLAARDAEIERLRLNRDARDKHIEELLRDQSDPQFENAKLRARCEELEYACIAVHDALPLKTYSSGALGLLWSDPGYPQQKKYAHALLVVRAALHGSLCLFRTGLDAAASENKSAQDVIDAALRGEVK